MAWESRLPHPVPVREGFFFPPSSLLSAFFSPFLRKQLEAGTFELHDVPPLFSFELFRVSPKISTP